MQSEIIVSHDSVLRKDNNWQIHLLYIILFMNDIWKNILLPDQIALLAVESRVVTDKSVVNFEGTSVPITEELVLWIAKKHPFFTVLSWLNTACGKSIVMLTERGQERVRMLLELSVIQESILEFLSTGTHNIHTLTRHVGRPFSENQIEMILRKMEHEGRVSLVRRGLYSLAQ